MKKMFYLKMSWVLWLYFAILVSPQPAFATLKSNPTVTVSATEKPPRIFRERRSLLTRENTIWERVLIYSAVAVGIVAFFGFISAAIGGLTSIAVAIGGGGTSGLSAATILIRRMINLMLISYGIGIAGGTIWSIRLWREWKKGEPDEARWRDSRNRNIGWWSILLSIFLGVLVAKLRQKD